MHVNQRTVYLCEVLSGYICAGGKHRQKGWVNTKRWASIRTKMNSEDGKHGQHFFLVIYFPSSIKKMLGKEKYQKITKKNSRETKVE